eukprot:Nk52_evm81s1737 gene=Nk52_evmTU81s1737
MAESVDECMSFVDHGPGFVDEKERFCGRRHPECRCRSKVVKQTRSTNIKGKVLCNQASLIAVVFLLCMAMGQGLNHEQRVYPQSKSRASNIVKGEVGGLKSLRGRVNGLERVRRNAETELAFKPTLPLEYDDVKDNEVFMNTNGHITEQVVAGACYVVSEFKRDGVCESGKCGVCFPRVLGQSNNFVVDYPLTSVHGGIVFENDCNYHDNKNRQFCIAPSNAVNHEMPKFISRDLHFSTRFNLSWFQVPNIPGTCAIVASPYYVVCFPRNIKRTDIVTAEVENSQFNMYYSGFSRGNFANEEHFNFVKQHFLKIDIPLYTQSGEVVTNPLVGVCGKYYLDRNGTVPTCISHPDFPEYEWSSKPSQPVVNMSDVDFFQNITAIDNSTINHWLGVRRTVRPTRKLVSLTSGLLVEHPIEGFCYSYNYSLCDTNCGLCIPHVIRNGAGNATSLRLYHTTLTPLAFEDKKSRLMEGTCGYYDPKLNITFCIDFAYSDVVDSPKIISVNESKILEKLQFDSNGNAITVPRGTCGLAPAPLGYSCMPLKVPHIVSRRSENRTGYGFADYWIDSMWKEKDFYLTMDTTFYDALGKVVANPQVGRCDYHIYSGTVKHRACILFPEYEDDVFEIGANGNLVGIVNSGESSNINDYPDLSDINIELYYPPDGGVGDGYNTSTLNLKLKTFGYASCAWEGLSEEECSKGCDPTCINLYQDGVCHQDCNSFNCAYDGGDCTDKLVDTSSIFQTLLLAELDMDYPSFQKISTEYLIFLGSVLDSVILVNKTYSTAQIGESPTTGRTKIMFNYWRAKRSVLTSPRLVVEYLNNYVRNESMPYMRAISEQPVIPSEDSPSDESDDEFASSAWFIAILSVAFVAIAAGVVVYKRKRASGVPKGKKVDEINMDNCSRNGSDGHGQVMEEDFIFTEDFNSKKSKAQKMDIAPCEIGEIPVVPCNPKSVRTSPAAPAINPLHTALLTNDMESFQHYISKYKEQGNATLQAYVNDTNVPGKFSPLMIACRAGNAYGVSHLLRCGCNVELQNDDGVTALGIACSLVNANTPKIVQLLLEYGASARVAAKDNCTPLHTACACGELSVVELLCSRDAEVNKRDNDGATPLTNAVKYGNSSIVKFLLSVIIFVDGADNRKWTALHWAAANGNVEIVRLLLSKNCKMNESNEKGETPLFLAAREGHLPIVQMLLARNASKKIADRFDRTPLDIALLRGHKGVADTISGGQIVPTNMSSPKCDSDIDHMEISSLVATSPVSNSPFGVVPGDSDVGGFLNYNSSQASANMPKLSHPQARAPASHVSDATMCDRSTCSPKSIAVDECSPTTQPEQYQNSASPDNNNNAYHSSSPTVSNCSHPSPNPEVDSSNNLSAILEERMPTPIDVFSSSTSPPVYGELSPASAATPGSLSAIIEERVAIADNNSYCGTVTSPVGLSTHSFSDIVMANQQCENVGGVDITDVSVSYCQ